MSLAALPSFPGTTAPPLVPRRSPLGLAAIAGAHLLGVWALLQADVIHRALHPTSPLMVAVLSNPTPPRPPEPPPLPVARTAPTPPPQALMPPPEVNLAAAPAAPLPAVLGAVVVASISPPAPAPSPVPAEVAVPRPAASAASAATVPATPPTPPLMPASAIRYRVPPPIEVPMASRRLGEAGTVLLRVWVDAQGQPRQVSLQRSSGFARLDEQAQAAMRQARFQPILQPVSEGGSAIEWVVIAPLQYEID